MKLSSLRLQNYRNISNSIIDLSNPITAFIGLNDSGKTSILDAIFACLSKIELPHVIERHLKKGETIIEVGFYLNPEEWVQLFREIGYQKFYLSLKECEDFKEFELKKRYVWTINNGRITAKNEVIFPILLDNEKLSKYTEHFSQLQKIGSKNFASKFGVVKISPAGQKLSLGDKFIPYNTIKTEEIINQINVWLLHLQRKFPTSYEKFLEDFKALFPELDSIGIFFDQDKGSIRLDIEENKKFVSITEMGQGFHSSLLLFSFLINKNFKIIIVDEPFVHMHAARVRTMVNYLKGISENKQIIIATHNNILINCLSLSSIILLSKNKAGKFTPASLENSEFKNILLELGVSISEDLILDLDSFEETKAAQILVEKVKPQVFKHATSALDYLDNKSLSYYSKIDISLVDLQEGSKAHDLMLKLKVCPIGKDGWSQYQDVCSEILSFVFSPPLLKPIPQCETEGREQRRDLIIHIPFDVGNFWGWIQYSKSPSINCYNC